MNNDRIELLEKLGYEIKEEEDTIYPVNDKTPHTRPVYRVYKDNKHLFPNMPLWDPYYEVNSTFDKELQNRLLKFAFPEMYGKK